MGLSNSLGKLLTRRSLRVDILTAFGGLLLVTVLVVMFYFYRNTTRVVLMLCDDLMEQTTQTVINRTVRLSDARSRHDRNEFTLAGTKVLPFSNLTHLEYYAIQTLNTYPQIAQFIIGDQSGELSLVQSAAGWRYRHQIH